MCSSDLLGRLTLNPIKHIDLFYTIILPLLLYFLGGIVFGAAKPVPVNPRNFRDPVKDDIIVSSAGVLTNFLLAVFFAAVIHTIIKLGTLNGAELSPAAYTAIKVALWGALINLILGVFNLVPIPPLDGSHLFKYLLPPDLRVRYMKIGFFGMILVLLFLYTGAFSKIVGFAIQWFVKLSMLDPVVISRALA